MYKSNKTEWCHRRILNFLRNIFKNVSGSSFSSKKWTLLPMYLPEFRKIIGQSDFNLIYVIFPSRTSISCVVENTSLVSTELNKKNE